MQIKTQKNIINVMAVMAVLIMLSLSSKWDAEDAQIAEQQAQYIKELARQDRAQQLHEAKIAQFNALAEKGEYMTSFAGNTK